METPLQQVEIIQRYFGEFTPQQLRQWTQLDAVYREWNERINVISRRDIDSLYERHVLHSLAIATGFVFPAGAQIVDIGTGGGFPGIPLAIFFPEATFHLVDSIGKKIKVVEEAVKALGLTNVRTYHARAESLPKGAFDFAVSRAVAPLLDLWTWGRPLLRNQHLPGSPHKNGLVCLKGGDLTDEIARSGLRPHVWELSTLFTEPWFAEKYMVYVPR
ncbi:16S rRNA (guanine(527)-N(7))-methyltransferase RsmG [Dinghuibacter silviterrae]|uniref:Ribosomal RNA small subunit methyltransferase G n=1 Tax=Dinghuibacter silviterrae TaxID=1539049 RepID=A0A4R8DRH5_9BACT|nr:16S rRNA (guanine(527)-N(7))-methyltransferase RsmG [Dinghuibacter silviterrae]TDX00436.1 16S rRNA m(7)G-527 methyltransferase [Dinghuibacter silviterrae]